MMKSWNIGQICTRRGRQKTGSFHNESREVAFWKPSLTCCVLFYFFEDIVVIHILLLLIPLIHLLCAVLNRDHCEVGGHFYTTCFFSESSVTLFFFLASCCSSVRQAPLFPFFPYFLPLSIQTCSLSLVSRCQVIVTGMSFLFVPVEDSAVHPCDPTVQIRKSMTAPPKGGGIYKKMQTYRNHDIHFEICEQLHSPSRKAEITLCFRKDSYTPHTFPLFFQWHSIHTVCTHPSYTGKRALPDNVCLIMSVWHRERSFTVGDGKQSKSQPHFTQTWTFWDNCCHKCFISLYDKVREQNYKAVSRMVFFLYLLCNIIK